jgi:hypothetical protein
MSDVALDGTLRAVIAPDRLARAEAYLLFSPRHAKRAHALAFRVCARSYCASRTTLGEVRAGTGKACSKVKKRAPGKVE